MYRFDDADRSVSRSVVQEIDLNTLLNQIADDVLDDVGLVVRGNDRHDVEA